MKMRWDETDPDGSFPPSLFFSLIRAVTNNWKVSAGLVIRD